MNKICTSVEQSKKLLELGIDRKTSDMYYWCGGNLRIGGYKAQDEELDIPAWSLAALLEILPNDEVTSTTITRGGWNIESAKYLDIWFAEYETEKHDNDFSLSMDNPIDAAFEMIVKLKEQNLL